MKPHCVEMTTLLIKLIAIYGIKKTKLKYFFLLFFAQNTNYFHNVPTLYYTLGVAH